MVTHCHSTLPNLLSNRFVLANGSSKGIPHSSWIGGESVLVWCTVLGLVVNLFWCGLDSQSNLVDQQFIPRRYNG